MTQTGWEAAPSVGLRAASRGNITRALAPAVAEAEAAEADTLPLPGSRCRPGTFASPGAAEAAGAVAEEAEAEVAAERSCR